MNNLNISGPLFNLIGVVLLIVVPGYLYWIAMKAIKEDAAKAKKDPASVAPLLSFSFLVAVSIWFFCLCHAWSDYAHYLGGFPK